MPNSVPWPHARGRAATEVWEGDSALARAQLPVAGSRAWARRGEKNTTQPLPDGHAGRQRRRRRVRCGGVYKKGVGAPLPQGETRGAPSAYYKGNGSRKG